MADLYTPDINNLLAAHLLSKTVQPAVQVSPTDLASALKAQGGNAAFGTVDPTQLFGLTPEDVMGVAKERNTSAYQKMLTDLGALDFVQKLTGVKASEATGTEVVLQAMKDRGDIAKQNLANKGHKEAASEGDPLRKMAANIISRIAAGKPVKPVEADLARKFTNEDELGDKLAVGIVAKADAKAAWMADPTNKEHLQQAPFWFPDAVDKSSDLYKGAKKRLDRLVAAGAATPESASSNGAKTITPEIAGEYLKKYGSKEKAREAAKKEGYTW